MSKSRSPLQSCNFLRGLELQAKVAQEARPTQEAGPLGASLPSLPWRPLEASRGLTQQMGCIFLWAGDLAQKAAEHANELLGAFEGLKDMLWLGLRKRSGSWMGRRKPWAKDVPEVDPGAYRPGPGQGRGLCGDATALRESFPSVPAALPRARQLGLKLDASHPLPSVSLPKQRTLKELADARQGENVRPTGCRKVPSIARDCDIIFAKGCEDAGMSLCGLTFIAFRMLPALPPMLHRKSRG